MTLLLLFGIIKEKVVVEVAVSNDYNSITTDNEPCRLSSATTHLQGFCLPIRSDFVEYFKHDINASEDDKICELLANGGYEMFGYYWRFVEYLYSRGGFVYKNKLNSVAWILHMEINKLNDLIYKFGLFIDSDETIYSKRVLQEVQDFESNGKRMAEIGRKGGQASAKAKAQAHAKAYGQADGQADAQQNKKNKKNKEKKENKENNTPNGGFSPSGILPNGEKFVSVDEMVDFNVNKYKF